ncbi:ricin-type beta-trefoil lectin domain protein [Kitasatospora sp. NPDC056531]|uniref:ricin-type beta-trefoil lectin domain protein n=1 Tax=Kitasatospora sp. NPDC056531 TaxID=3345856 RepID=UPI003695649F
MAKSSIHRAGLPAVLILLLGALTSLVRPTTAGAVTTAATAVTIDGTQPGLTFDGIGAISGGGGNTRLLVDYPEPQRTQLLDYLFKPGYGASLQLLKIEIGGDTNSTDGAEASHEHTQGVVDCDQGYEWWLAAQAKARNPGIKLYGLSWGAPGWVGGGNNTFFTPNAISYLMDWMGCARQHGLTIDYLGGWNERGFDASWYENLKSSLVSNGYGGTKVVASDNNGWSVADAMTTDPAFRNAVDIVGVHYPCGYLGSFSSCQSTANARGLGKPLWASENGSEDATDGAPAVARGINRDYLDGRMTTFINWPVIAALYPNLYFSTDGMSIANQPWSGNYLIGKTTWVTAHTTQFTQPGWRYIDPAGGYLSGGGGSYVTLRSTTTDDYSTVLETMDATAAQTVNLQVTGGLSGGTVHVWATDVNSGNTADHFVHQSDVTPGNGRYSLTLQPGHVYTLTTTSTVPGTTAAQGKGNAAPPPAAPLALPYGDDFTGATGSTSPKYFTDMNGAFAKVPCAGGQSGTCLQQMATGTPVRWTNEPYANPYTLMGDGGWSNYTVSAKVLIRQQGSVELLGRVGQQGRNNNGLNAYHLRVSDTGAWSILRSDLNWNFTTLAQGTVGALGTDSWHSVALTMQDSNLTAVIDGTAVGSVSDDTFTSGQAGLGVVGYQNDQFARFAVTPGNGSAALGGNLGFESGDCSGWNCYGGAGAVAGNAHSGAYSVQLPPNSGAEQTISGLTPNTAYVLSGWAKTSAAGQCVRLGVKDFGGTETSTCLSGTSYTRWVVRFTTGANSTSATVYQWNPPGNTATGWGDDLALTTGPVTGALVLAASNSCLDIPGATTNPGTRLDIWSCNTGSNQTWTHLAEESLQVYSGSALRCLDDLGSSTAPGAPVGIWNCNGGLNQHWRFNSDGTVTTPAAPGLCLAAPAGKTADGTLLGLQPCVAGAASQRWNLA